MIDFVICRHCGHCKWSGPKRDERDEMVVVPSIRCELTGDVLLMNSEVPEGCPYVLEHVVFTHNIPEPFADHMSGAKREKDDDET